MKRPIRRHRASRVHRPGPTDPAAHAARPSTSSPCAFRAAIGSGGEVGRGELALRRARSRSGYRRYGVRLAELMSEGNVGLMTALAKFDPERGTRFVTYAAHWIRAFILDHVIRA